MNQIPNYWSYIKNNISNTFELRGILDVVFYKDDNDYKRILCSLLYVASCANEKIGLVFKSYCTDGYG